MDADPRAPEHAAAPVPNEMLVLGSGNTRGNIIGLGLEGVAGQDVARSQGSGRP